MLSTARTFVLDGISASPVRAEVDVRRGIPGFSVLGLSDNAAREPRERIRAALLNCDFEFPLGRVAVNVAPASLRRTGPGFDLPLAVALLVASGQLEWERAPRVAMVGELGLDGSVRPVPGVVSIAEAAREAGVEALLVPAANGQEAALIEGLEVLPLHSLGQLRRLMSGEWAPRPPQPLAFRPAPAPRAPDLADLRGQPQLRYASELAAAGGHSLLMVGPPGAGKSMAAVRIPSILPPLSPEEALEVARVASACGRLSRRFWGTRPFRAPHHTITPAALVGSGWTPLPGEVTVAHRGVLFLDELSDFRRDALEALRGPLESGWVTVKRRGSTRRLPGRVQLVAAVPPCPCGRGTADPECVCKPLAVRRHEGRVASALADRMDIQIAVEKPSTAEIGGPPGETSAIVRERVCAARERQEARLGKGRCNAEMSSNEARACTRSAAATELLDDTYRRRRMSGRAHDRVLRIARTVADLEGAEAIERVHLAKAIEMRRGNR